MKLSEVKLGDIIITSTTEALYQTIINAYDDISVYRKRGHEALNVSFLMPMAVVDIVKCYHMHEYLTDDYYNLICLASDGLLYERFVTDGIHDIYNNFELTFECLSV